MVDPEEPIVCAACGRRGAGRDVAAGWSVNRPARATGRTGPRTDDEQRIRALCPDCTRRYVRDLEARLDPW